MFVWVCFQVECLCNPQTRLTSSTSSSHHGPRWLCVASLPLLLLFTVVSFCHWFKNMNLPNSVFKWFKPPRPDWTTSRTLKASVLKQQSVMQAKQLQTNSQLVLFSNTRLRLSTKTKHLCWWAHHKAEAFSPLSSSEHALRAKIDPSQCETSRSSRTPAARC